MLGVARFTPADTVTDTVKKRTLSIHAGFRAIEGKQPFADIRRRSGNRRIFHVTNVADIEHDL